MSDYYYLQIDTVGIAFHMKKANEINFFDVFTTTSFDGLDLLFQYHQTLYFQRVGFVDW
jgi:hypothetical protein